MNTDLILCMCIDLDQIFSTATFLCDPDLSVQGHLIILVNLSGLWIDDVCLSVCLSVYLSVYVSVNILVNLCIKVVLGHVYEYRLNSMYVYRP